MLTFVRPGRLIRSTFKGDRNVDVLLDESPVAPEGGDGKTTVEQGSTEVELTWKAGQIVGVAIAKGATHSAVPGDDKTLEPGTSGVVTCRKCAKDSQSGVEVCWDVPC
jgi:hypothetical protein